ncbi:hypothetical protein CN692_12345 [Bacillus sp. AFS002410]|nr:hypothetical protein CN692_12345 [Bacillus sp. AFS002410]
MGILIFIFIGVIERRNVYKNVGVQLSSQQLQIMTELQIKLVKLQLNYLEYEIRWDNPYTG